MRSSVKITTRSALGGSLTALLAVAIAVGCGRADPSATGAAPSPSGAITAGGALYDEAAAARIADGLLARVPVPAGTDRVAAPPRAVARLMGRPRNSEWNAKSVDRHEYWVSSLAPADILSFVARHGPARRNVASGSGAIRGRTYEWWEILAVPLAGPLAGPREVFVSIAAAGRGRYAVRVDAVVAWHRRRPASSLVPADARSLEVEVVRPAFRGFRGEPARPRRARRLKVVDTRTVVAVARLVDELPLAEPVGPVPSCPATSVADAAAPERMVLTFRAARSARVVARVDSGVGAVCARAGEATARIALPGEPALALTDHLNGIAISAAASFSGGVEAALGRTLRLD